MLIAVNKMHLSDYQRMNLGVPLCLVTSALKPLTEFSESAPGKLVSQRLIFASDNLIAGHAHRDNLLRQLWRGCAKLEEYLKPRAEADKMFPFLCSVSLIADIEKLDPRNKRSGVKGYPEFVELMTNLRDRSTFADTIAETKDFYMTVEALRTIGKVNDVFRY